MSERKRARRPSLRGRPLSEIFADWTRAELEARFYVKVNQDGPVPAHRPELGHCYVWTGDHSPSGYGLLRRVGAHRVALWLATGEEPGSRHTLHHCDNPPCVRPSHLHYGTHRRNMEEMAERGRAAKPGLKLTDAQVQELRQRYAAGEKIRDLRHGYGISQQQANRIVAGVTRKLAPVDVEWRARGLRDSRSRLTAEQRQEIRDRRAAGEPVASVAASYGISEPYVSEVVNGRPHRNRHPSGPPRVRVTHDLVREIRSLYATGEFRQADLASRYGIERSYVSRIVARAVYADVV